MPRAIAKSGHLRNHLYGDLRRIAHAFTQVAQRARRKAGAALDHTWDTAKERANTAQENVADYVGDKPFKSIGLAVIAGAVFGYFMHK